MLLLLLLTELPAPTVAHKRLQLQQGRRDPIQDNFMNSLSTLWFAYKSNRLCVIAI